ncbi:MAG: hypothetical protein ACKO96_37255 [Flammeovirgaceae bacterium]
MHTKSSFATLLLTVIFAQCLLAQDSTATVYFFREGKFAGSFIGYDVKHQGNVIGRIKSNSVFSYQSPAGLQTFSATTESESSIKIQLLPGQTYFIECGIAIGLAVGRPVFRQTSGAEAKRKIEAINSTVASQIPAQLTETVQPNDTVRALQNMFQRKRKGGGTRAAVFGAITVVAVVGIATYTPETVTINQGAAGSQNLQVGSSSPPAGSFLLGGASAILAISGFAQVSKYSTEKLERLLDNYKNGRPLPREIKAQLRQKDFK